MPSTPSEPAPSAKRKELQGGVQSSSTKKQRTSLRSSSQNYNSPYTTLPPPTTFYIQLRFQLCGFNHVYRVVQLPLSYTFANLHTLILFLFGWTWDHLHQSHVYSHVELSSEDNGHMKKYGQVPPPPEWISPDDEREMYFWALEHPDSAIYEVVPKISGRRPRHRSSFHDFTYETRVEDQELALGHVWNENKKKNASEGECTNQEIGIKYEYDFGMSWMVHITCESEAPFISLDSPSNAPILIRAQGAPPMQDIVHEIIDELDAEDKRISDLLYSPTSFELYCKGELHTRACKEELVVYNVKEERARLQEIRERRERRKAEGQDALGDDEDEDDEDEDDY